MADYVYIGWECYSDNGWVATHPMYDGAPDSPTRSYYVRAGTLSKLKVAIELWERENGLDVTEEVGIDDLARRNS